MMVDDKMRYIARRYLEKNIIPTRNKWFNGFHIEKGRREARPFSSFYPKLENIKRNSADN